MSEYPTFEEWLDRFATLGPEIAEALYDQALTPCLDCGLRGVPLSWAVVAAETALKEMGR